MDAGAVIANRFEIVRRAAVGGMGAVYAAHDRTTGAMAAVKIVRIGVSEHTERLWHEARALAHLDHPNVVRYLAHGTTDEGDPFVAMEWIEGESLAHRLKRQPLSVGESVSVVARAAEALGHAHAHGIVHRDIKPGNLILRGDDVGDVVLVDFGIARSHLREELTRTGVIIGTPAFMSPEQARGVKRLEPTSDVFALGCLLYRCLTGRNAFAADEPLAVVVKILLEDPPPISTVIEIDLELAELTGRLLSKDPAQRPRDGAAVADALRRIQPRTKQDKRFAPAATALTLTERRLVSLVLTPTELDVEATPSGDESRNELGPLRAVASRFGAICELLPNGTLVVALAGRASATEQASLAARCALELKDKVRGAPLALVTGRAVVDASDTLKGITHTQTDAFEAAARHIVELQRADARGCIVIDETTAGLLDRTFIIGPHERGLELRGVREDVGVERLLGKVIACVGREREHATLDALLTECQDETVSRCALVLAPAGLGKSRLLRELVSRTGTRAETFQAKADAFASGSPFALVAQLLRTVAGIDASDTDTTRARKLRARVARHLRSVDVASVAEFLGEVASVHLSPNPSERLAAARADPRLMAEHVRGAWTAWLAAECAARTVLIVLDDVQSADPLSIGLMNDVLSSLPESPLCLVLGARPEALEGLPQSLIARSVHLSLGALSRKASERLVRDALGAVSEEVVTAIVARAGGQPLVLEELVRSHAHGHDDRGETAAVAMVQSRLESLDPECRRVLRAASIFGEVFWRGGVEHLVSKNVSAQLDMAISQELVAPRPSSRHADESELGFRHALVRDAAYAMLTQDDAELGHRLAAEWLEKRAGAEAWSLAEHFARSDQPKRAIPFLRRTAEQALEAGDFTSASACVARARAIGVDGAEGGALLVIDADAKRWSGMTQAAEDSALAAIQMTTVGTVEWLAAARLGMFCAGMLVHTEILESIVTRVRDIEPTTDTERAWLLAAAQGAGALASVTSRAATDLRARIERLPREALDADPALATLHFHAVIAMAIYNARWETVLEASKAAVDRAVRAGDVRSSVFIEINMVFAHGQLGEYEAALDAVARARVMASGGLVLPLLTIEQNRGFVLMCLGRLDEARAIEAAVAAAAKDPTPRIHTAALSCLTRILVRMGKTEEAVARAHEALHTVASEEPIWRIYPLASMAEALLAHGDAAGALASAQEALDMASRVGGHQIGYVIANRVAAEALAALGRMDEARQEVDRGLSLIRAQATNVRDAARRKTLLERVDDNRRVIELGVRLGRCSADSLD